MIFEEGEEDDEVVVVVVVGLEKEWKKAWGLVNMISLFVLSFPAGLSWNGLQKRGGGLPFSRKLWSSETKKCNECDE